MKDMESAILTLPRIRPLKSPFFLNLDLTNNCNWKCRFCYVERDCNARDQYVPYDSFVTILDRVSSAEVFSVNLFGGEPTLHPRFLDIARYARGKGFDVGVVTNGSTLAGYDHNELAEILEGCSISVHGFEDTHDSLTGTGGSFRSTLDSIEKLSSSKVRVGVCYTYVKENMAELGRFCEFILNRFNISTFSLGRFIPSSSATRNGLDIAPSVKDLNEGLRTLAAVASKHPSVQFGLGVSVPYCIIDSDVKQLARSCSAGISFGAIDIYGNVKICSGSTHVLGNVLEDDLIRIWQDSEKCRYFRSMEWLDEECKACNLSQTCLAGCKITRTDKLHFSTDILGHLKNNEKLSRRCEVKIREDLETTYLYYRGSVYEANEVSRDILLLSDGSRDIREVSATIAQKYSVDENLVLRDVIEYRNEYPFLFEQSNIAESSHMIQSPIRGETTT
jgi:radical SAM protein with 4Fe4S-binding SPASM domain